jgi:outer membrane receptor for ferrienterochelin and colicin
MSRTQVYILSIISCFLTVTLSSVHGQTKIQGTVTGLSPDGSREPLVGASVYQPATLKGTTTNINGKYELILDTDLPAELVSSFVGYVNDTIIVKAAGRRIDFSLSSSLDIEEVDIVARKSSTEISTIKPVNVETLGSGELLKAACCNLSESFETNPSVNVSYSDAVTGAKEIQMLGLSGIYSQVMTENIPNLRGLASPYGLGFIPGPWMESIQITKGNGSVANGFESTTGQINVEFIKPQNADPFYLNLYGNIRGRLEANTHVQLPVSNKVNGLLFLHGQTQQAEHDRQDDGFLDMPKSEVVNLYNRWYYHSGKRIEGQIGVRALYDSRIGGQIGFDKDSDFGNSSKYGVEVRNKRLEVYTKTGLVFPETPWKSMGLILQGTYHNLDSYFGNRTFEGTQKGFYGSAMIMSILGNTNHKYKAGIDFRYDDFSQQYNDLEFPREEIVPGGYLEYTLDHGEKFGAVAGVRLDHHNRFEWFATPRLHVKYNITPQFIIRGTGGRSFRTANVFADNLSKLASYRELSVIESLDPEVAWNYGGNATFRFRLDYREGSVSADYYFTQFSNQVVVDLYSSPDMIEVYNLRGDSYSRSFQIALNYEVLKRVDLRIAWKLDDVVVSYREGEIRKPLVPRQRGLLNLAYSTKDDHYLFDLTFQVEGSKELGIYEYQNYSDGQIKNGSSPVYSVVNMQITRILGDWQLYAGAENMFDFRQEKVIFGASDPFGAEFDATNVWGPVIGRNIYLGIRYNLKKK